MDPDTQAQQTAEAVDSTPSRNPTSLKRRRSRSGSVSSSEGCKRSTSPGKTDGADANAAQDEPSLPEEAPPLPDEAPPEDDGWEAAYDEHHGRWYFYNRFTQVYQWENPRVPNVVPNSGAPGTTSSSGAPGTNSSGAPGTSSPPRRLHGGYNPAIHGSYDPNADYALAARREEEEQEAAAAGLPDHTTKYATTAHFNRFTGRFQNASINPDNHSDENKSRRQMSAFFDVDAAANSHDGRSLKAERQGKKLSKQELRAFQKRNREKKEQKRRQWLKD
ncbi:hypothetical protein K469DRAFT_594455 [Zopfia rhizophila CBS 207.26]|uniref:WW domain-containing protein n=1 Tax=Zopfia rhizophila CBS 207.26 TaxID=1314779 RepID=A0A6A6DP93_9PEZI|nr:hypothetical protein K469DRAFT_594455 [Zopfia rhizophila CBS 207.26]